MLSSMKLCALFGLFLPCARPRRLLPSRPCDVPLVLGSACSSPPHRDSVIRSRIRHIPAVACVVAVAFGVASAATAEPGPVASKEAEAQSIISRISTIETELSTAVERWNLANVKLERIGHNLQRARFELGIARTNYKQAQVALARQALDVYTSGDSNSTLEVLLGAASLDDLLTRIDNVNRVNDQRTDVVGDVKVFRHNVAREEAKLHRSQSEQKRVVSRLERAGCFTGTGRRGALVSILRSRRDRDAVSRHAVRLGRRIARWLRLFRVGDVRVRAGGRVVAALELRAVRHGRPGVVW